MFEEYGIGKYISNRSLRRNVGLQRNLLEYLTSNNMDLIIEKQDGSHYLNPIINAFDALARTTSDSVIAPTALLMMLTFTP